MNIYKFSIPLVIWADYDRLTSKDIFVKSESDTSPSKEEFLGVLKQIEEKDSQDLSWRNHVASLRQAVNGCRNFPVLKSKSHTYASAPVTDDQVELYMETVSVKRLEIYEL